MKEIVSVIGLTLELWGVLFLAALNFNKITTLDKFPLTRSLLQKILAYVIGITMIAIVSVITVKIRNTSSWALVMWLLSHVVTVTCLPALVIYIKRYCRGIEPLDLQKIQQLNIRGLILLAAGFILQSLGVVLGSG